MARRSWVTIPSAALVDGQLPPISVISDEPADAIIDHKVRPANENTVVLIGGVLLLAIVRLFSKKGVIHLRVPVTSAEASRHNTMRIARGVTTAVGLVMMLIGVAILPRTPMSGARTSGDGGAILLLIGGLVLLLVAVLLRPKIVTRHKSGEVAIKAGHGFAAALASSPRYAVYAPSNQPAWGGSAVSAAAAQPAGWYPDPSRLYVQRWWNGSAWTGDVVDATGRQLQG